MQSEEEEQRHLARHGADLTPSPRTGAIVDELLQGVVSDNFATGDSSAGAPDEAQPQPHAALLPDSEPKPQSPGALQGQWPIGLSIQCPVAFLSSGLLPFYPAACCLSIQWPVMLSTLVLLCHVKPKWLILHALLRRLGLVACGAELAFGHLHALPV